MPIFKSIINFLTFRKPIRLIIPRGLSPHIFSSDIMIWRGTNLDKFMQEIIVRCWIAISGLRSAWIKIWRKQTPTFFKTKNQEKKWGYIFFNFFIWALLRPQIAIRQRANISRVIFSWFWPLKIEKSEKKLYGHNPLRILNHIGD